MDTSVISDLCKFGDLVVTLNKKTDCIKEGLYNVIKVVGVDESSEVNSPISPDDEHDFAATKLILFSDPSLKNFVKNVLKKFPSIGDLTKVTFFSILYYNIFIIQIFFILHFKKLLNHIIYTILLPYFIITMKT